MKNFIFLFLWLINVNSFSQQFNFKSYGLEDGLAQSQVYAVTQDDNGFLWVGTQGGGVSIFDGHSFQSNLQGLTNNYINQLKKHPNKGIWVGTDDGLFLYSQEKKIIKTLLKNHEINTLTINGNLCFVGTNKGVFLISPTNKVTQITKQDTQTLFYWKEKLYIGTDKGITIFENDVIKSSIDLPLIRSFFEMNNELFVCTYSQGIFKLTNKKLIHQSHLPTKHGITSSYYAPNGAVWITTISDGTFCIKENKVVRLFNKKTGLPSNSVQTIFEDNRKAIWIGSNGLFQFINDDILSINQKEIGVHSVLRIEDKLFLGTFSGGLTIVSLANEKKTTTHFTKKKVKVVTQMPNETLWIGTDGDGVFSFENNKFRPLFSSNKKLRWVRAIATDGKENKWLGSLGFGLFHHKGTKITRLKNALFSRVNDLYYHSPKELFVATDNGLFVLNTLTNTYGKPLYSGACRSLTFCDGLLFVGTKNEGVFYLKKSKLHKLKNTWSDNTYFVRTGVRSNLWIGSEKGVQKISFPSLQFPEIINIGKNRGLLGIETCVNSFASDSLGVWVGTLKGVSYLKKHDFKYTNH